MKNRNKFYLNAKESAEFLGISDRTFSDKYLHHQSGFPACRVPGSRRIIIPREALEEWMKEKATQGI